MLSGNKPLRGPILPQFSIAIHLSCCWKSKIAVLSNFIVTYPTTRCHVDKIRCYQWRQSWNNDSVFSFYMIINIYAFMISGFCSFNMSVLRPLLCCVVVCFHILTTRAVREPHCAAYEEEETDSTGKCMGTCQYPVRLLIIDLAKSWPHGIRFLKLSFSIEYVFR